MSVLGESSINTMNVSVQITMAGDGHDLVEWLVQGHQKQISNVIYKYLNRKIRKLNSENIFCGSISALSLFHSTSVGK